VPFLVYAGFIEGVYSLPYYMSLRRLDTSIITALFELGHVMLPALAYFMVGEKLSVLQYCGFFLIIFTSVWLSLGRRRGATGGRKINSAFWLMLFTSFLLTVSAVFQKSALESISWISLVFWMGIISSMSVMPLIFIRRTRKDIVLSWKRFHKKSPIVALTNFCAFVGMITQVFAMSRMPITLEKAIHASQPFFGLLFGVILAKIYKRNFGEVASRRAILKKMTGFLILFAGIMLTILGG